LKKIVVIKNIEDYLYFKKKDKFLEFYANSIEIFKYFRKNNIKFYKFTDINLKKYDYSITSRNFKFYKKYLDALNNLNKVYYKKYNYNIPSFYAHIYRGYFFNLLNIIDIIYKIKKKFYKYEITFCIDKNDKILKNILLGFQENNNNIKFYESDKDYKISKENLNHAYKNIKLYNLNYFYLLYKIIIFYKLRIFSLLFHKLTKFKFCKEINLVFLDSLSFSEQFKKNFFLFESFFSITSLNKFAPNQVIKIEEKKNYFSYKQINLSFFFSNILTREFEYNFSNIKLLYEEFITYFKKKNFNLVVSKFNQFPLQSLIFDQISNFSKRTFVGYHGAAYNFYKNSPVMDVMSTNFETNFFCASKEHLKLLKMQKKKFNFIINKSLINLKKFNSMTKAEFKICYVCSDIGDLKNSELKLVNGYDDVSYLNFIEKLYKKMNQNGYKLSIKIKRPTDLNAFDEIIPNDYLEKRKLSNIMKKYDYFIFSHFSSAIYELLLCQKKVILLLLKNNEKINSDIYRKLKKNILICKNENKLVDLLDKLKCKKIKFNPKKKDLIDFLKIYA